MYFLFVQKVLKRTSGLYKVKELCVSGNLTCHINEPTRVTDLTESCLDQIITNMPNFVVDTNVFPPVSTNDHCTVSVKLRFKIHKEEPYYRHIWLYEKGDFEGFRECISNYDWDTCFSSTDVNISCVQWTESLLNIARTYIPNKTVLVRPNDKPWYSNELRLFKRKLNRMYRSLRSMKDSMSIDPRHKEKWQQYKSMRNEYRTMIDKAVNDYNAKLNDVLGANDVKEKKWWNTVNKIIGRGNADTVPPMYDIVSDVYITHTKDKANAFNDFFLSHNKIGASNVDNPVYEGNQ
jgi:hypothetical protein